MSVRRLFDELQLRLHVIGMHRLAMFFSRWGTNVEYTRLRAINFDPTQRYNPGIDVDKEIAWPTTKFDVN